MRQSPSAWTPVSGRRAAGTAEAAWTIDAVIDQGAITTLFQPVVHLATGSVVGFEALSRGPSGSALEAPMALLAAAEAAGRLGELDWLCRVSAMQAAANSHLHPSLSWFINVEPAGLDIDCPDHLLPALNQARGGLRVVLEVVERDVQGHVTNLLRATDQARADAWGVALDDVGAVDASLAMLPFLQPDVVKLDLSLVQNSPGPSAAATTASVRAYAERTGAVILAEGIETAEHARLASVFGATYGQGFRYGQPGPLPLNVPPPRDVVPLKQRPEPHNGMSAFDIISAKLPPRRATKSHVLHISQHLEDLALTETGGSVLLAGFQDARFFTPAKRRRYQTIAELTALTVVLANNLDPHSTPRLHIGPLQPGSRLSHEWTVITTGPTQAAAFVGRDCGDEGPDGQRRFDYVYTHDRSLVAAAGRAFLRELSAPHLEDWLAAPAGPPAGSHSAPVGEALSRRRGWLRRAV